MRFFYGLCLILIGFAAAAAPSELIEESAYNLRPTQKYVGQDVVSLKAARLGRLSKEERREYLARNPVPVVKGPSGEYYMVDHHHMSLALIESGHKKLFIKVIADWSGLSLARFWNRMEKAGYAYLFDSEMKRIKPQALPKDVTGLVGDPFRSLSYFARKKGAYEKTDVKFAEFYWAGFYKKSISLSELKSNFEGSLKKAIDISNHEKALDLPGYKSVQMCRRFYQLGQ